MTTSLLGMRVTWGGNTPAENAIGGIVVAITRDQHGGWYLLVLKDDGSLHDVYYKLVHVTGGDASPFR